MKKQNHRYKLYHEPTREQALNLALQAMGEAKNL
jgi:hypothetical protein